VDFKLYPLRFEFIAKQSLFFPPGKASNILRGALGVIFRNIACVPECVRSGDARTCEIRRSCPYAKIFVPISNGAGPSGLADSPRPFVFRARHLDGHPSSPNRASISISTSFPWNPTRSRISSVPSQPSRVRAWDPTGAKRNSGASAACVSANCPNSFWSIVRADRPWRAWQNPSPSVSNPAFPG
jgi:hypothetical protein